MDVTWKSSSAEDIGGVASAHAAAAKKKAIAATTDVIRVRDLSSSRALAAILLQTIFTEAHH